MKTHLKKIITLAACLTAIAANAGPFKGQIHAVMTRDGESANLLYTAGTNSLRVELTGDNRPNPVNLVDLKSRSLLLVFPHNRSFVRLQATVENPQSVRPQLPLGLPPGIGPQSKPVAGSGIPARPAMSLPPMALMDQEKMELHSTGQRTNLLGFACDQYEIKQRGETLVVWATDQLLSFQPYVRNQMPGPGPRGIQEQWSGLLASRKLFPLRASLRDDRGAERFGFEVTSVKPVDLTDADELRLAPPTGYLEIQPLPF